MSDSIVAGVVDAGLLHTSITDRGCSILLLQERINLVGRFVWRDLSL